MIKHKICEANGTAWYVLGRDPNKSESVIDTCEYVVICGQEAMLLDPGGTEIFPPVVGAVSEIIDLQSITTFFCSHQDPDIMSSLPLWMGLCPSAKIHVSWVWSHFIAHFGHEYVKQFVPIPDEGDVIKLGSNKTFHLIPAHYCHSSGNFSLYDEINKLLFSGDIGAALLPETETGLFVGDFRNHVKYMEGFHKRWMPSNRAKNKWIERVRQLDVQYLCPQHGAIFEGENVGKFLDWFEQLEVGSAI